MVDIKTDVMAGLPDLMPLDELPPPVNADVPPTPDFDLDAEPKQEAFPTPGPGDAYAVYVMRWAALIDFADIAEAFAKTAKIAFPTRANTVAAGDCAAAHPAAGQHEVPHLRGDRGGHSGPRSSCA